MMKNNLRSNIENWISLEASDMVYNWIRHDIKFPLEGDISSYELPNGMFSTREEAFLNPKYPTCYYLDTLKSHIKTQMSQSPGFLGQKNVLLSSESY